MVSVSELLTLAVLVGVIAYWFSGMRAKELARREGRLRCQGLGLIFLDDTVVLKRLRLVRDGLSYMVFRREYHFEFSSDGSRRYRGEITLLGQLLEDIVMDAYRVPDQSPE